MATLLIYNMSEKKQRSIRKAPGTEYWVGAAAGAIAAAIGGTLLGIHIGRKQAQQSDLFKPDRPELLLAVNSINRSADLQTKLQSIDAHVNSDNWIDRLGGALVCFSELEAFLDASIHHLRPDYSFDRKNFHKKIGFLCAEGVISDLDRSLLERVSPFRNRLSHGNYNAVNDRDLKAACMAVREFFSRNLPSDLNT